MRLALETVVGILLGVALFVFAVVSSTDNYLMFFHVPSFLMVVGGTLAATMISFRGSSVVAALGELLRAIRPFEVSSRSLYAEVENIMRWAKIVKRKGMIGLEDEIGDEYARDPFLKFAGETLLTEYKGDELRRMLTNLAETTYDRNMTQSHILRTMGAFAPGFGMLGTVIGLIIMLDKMGSDPSELGRGLAFALITTLYGVLLAQFILKPAAEKARQKQEILRFRNLLLTEGFVMLAENKDYMLIQDMLNSFLDPSMHFSLVKGKPEQHDG
jgi:chemotaxis protein MotA